MRHMMSTGLDGFGLGRFGVGQGLDARRRLSDWMRTRRWRYAWAAGALAIAALTTGPGGPIQAQCGPNPIVCENQLTGNPKSEWDVSGSGDATIQGFATDISV